MGDWKTLKNEKKLNMTYKKNLTHRAKDRILQRIDAAQLSGRRVPDDMPDWAVRI